MIYATLAATIASVIVLVTGLWGYRASLTRRSNRAAHFLAWALALLTVKYMARGAVWDLLVPVLGWVGRDADVAWMFAHRSAINFVFPLIVLAGGACIHLSLYWSIPAAERRSWRRWTAWRHPAGGRRP